MCVTINQCPPKLWDSYVESHPQGTIYHLYRWKEVFRSVFGFSSYYLAYWEKGKIQAILPLIHMNSWIFGDKLFSLPIVDYGGVLASHSRGRDTLVKKARELGQKLGVRYLEFRPEMDDIYPYAHLKQGKVTFYLDINKSSQELFKGLKSSHRARIRKGENENLLPKWKGLEGLKEFYYLFSLSMHNHGTPVYPIFLFRKILILFPNNAKILLIYKNKTPIATAFTFFFKGKGEAPWIATPPLGHFRPTDYMYWEIIQYARDRMGCHIYDFGRCSKGSGTYHYKKKWGAKEKPLLWHTILIKDKELSTIGGDNPKHKTIIETWKKLPFWLVQWMGPLVSRNIP